MGELLNEKSRGVKLSIIDTCDYEDLRAIVDAIANLGYKITAVNNGNFVCEKKDEEN